MPNPKQTAPNFGYQQPSAPQIDRQRIIAKAAQDFAQVLTDTCPAGPELDQTLQWFRQTVLMADHSIVAMGLSQGTAR